AAAGRLGRGRDAGSLRRRRRRGRRCGAGRLRVPFPRIHHRPGQGGARRGGLSGPDRTRRADMTPAPVGADDLTYDADGLIPAIAQQFDSREVLMLAWMDAEAVRRTLATGAATYFSRSRQQYWVKGETSGHTQRVVEVRYDCDADALLLLV